MSSIEPRPVRRNITTEFEWEVRSLRERLAHEETFLSPRFDVHGTEGPGSPGANPWQAFLVFSHVGTDGILKLRPPEYYIVSVEAALLSGGHEAKSAAVESSGKDRSMILLSVDFHSPLGRAIQEDNGFSALVRITTVGAKGELVETVLQSKPKVGPPPSLAADLQDALASGELADVTLKSEGGAEFPAHRQVLAMRSPVFRAMFYGQMHEARSGAASIKASSASLQELLNFTYTDEIRTELADLVAGELFELGAQYEMPRLVALVKDQLLRTVSVDNAAERFLVAERHSADELGNASERIIRGNLAAVMKTKGWAQVAKDPEAMARLLRSSGKRKCNDDTEHTPLKLKLRRC